MSTRQQLIDAAKAAGRAALSTSVASAMTTVLTNLNSDPSTAVNDKVITAAANEISRVRDPKAAREFIEAVR